MLQVYNCSELSFTEILEGLVQDCSNPSALAKELLQFYTKSLIYPFCEQKKISSPQKWHADEVHNSCTFQFFYTHNTLCSCLFLSLLSANTNPVIQWIIWQYPRAGCILWHYPAISHYDVIKWKHFPHHWPFVRGIHRSPVNSPHKGQWRGALMFSLICVWINGWVNNREAGDLSRYHAHYDVTVMNSLDPGRWSSVIIYVIFKHFVVTDIENSVCEVSLN